MQFVSLPLSQVEGKILGHNIARRDGTRLMRKGRPLTAGDVQVLRDEGRSSVYVAVLEPGDVGEDAAAHDIAVVATGSGLRRAGAAGGRINLLADTLGVLRVDAARLQALNEVEGVTLATQAAHTAIQPRHIAATIKIIPYAIPASSLDAARRICVQAPLVWLDPLLPRAIPLVLSGYPAARERIVRDFQAPIAARLEALGSRLAEVRFIPLEDEGDEADLADALRQCHQRGDSLVILAGETANMDRHDIAPRAIERAGGEVDVFGAPVDPGNLLLIAHIGAMPVLGAPGCVRSRKQNVVDLVLPRLLAGDRLTRRDISQLAAGGLLDEIPERPMLRRSGESAQQ